MDAGYAVKHLFAKERGHEEDISAQQDTAQTRARLPGADEHGGGARHSSPQTRQRAEKINRLGFSPEHRLRRRPDFVHCYTGGRRFFSRNFVLFVIARPDAALPWRLGLAVTRKTGSAVWRNRVRRLLRECIRLLRPGVRSGFDVVVVPRRGLDPRRLTLEGVRAEIFPLLQGARVL
jgi:ribonuclease P protein component